MAPVKRSTAVNTTRATRTTRAGSIAKKQAAENEKKAVTASLPEKNVKAKPTTTTTRKTKKVVKHNDEPALESAENESRDTTQIVKPTRARSTRTTGPTVGLTAAPRRRIKITPLDPPSMEKHVVEENTGSTEGGPINELPIKKRTTRSRHTTVANDKESEASSVPEETTRSSKRGTSRSVDTAGAETANAPKTRGRSKSSQVEIAETAMVEPVAVAIGTAATRTTRSKRVNSVAASETVKESEAQQAKPALGVRKKVTFQDLPAENDKENQLLPQAKSKGAVTKQEPTVTAAAKGLRAKPLRKAATTTASGRIRKAASMNEKPSGRSSALDVSDVSERKMPTALTPKKIRQVARSSSPDREDQETSEGEDELNGGKTSIRDLSVSPRRPTTAALARALSPAKRLDFGQSIVPKSPDRITVARDSETEQSGILASPARRPAASPFKDAMKTSPKRGLIEGARFLFPIQTEQSSTIATGVCGANPSGQSMPTLLQSPKRAIPLDPAFFSQSAMKKSASKSPLKSSLFGSPAKRLFSPAKKSSTTITPLDESRATNGERKPESDEMEIESEISVSSLFRSSLSPLRVMRAEPQTADMDFDDSVLQVRSPLKVHKSSLDESFTPVASDKEQTCEPTTQPESIDGRGTQTVEPATLDVFQDAPSQVAKEAEGQLENVSTDPDFDVLASTSHPSSKKLLREGDISHSDSARRQSLSQVLFRSNKAISDEESSEDELAGGITPLRPQQRNNPGNVSAYDRSRLSTGVPQSAAAKGFGFTPLAAQMSGWLASSPEKSPEQCREASIPRGGYEFSPLARQHIDGEVLISRNSTPAQKLDSRKSIEVFTGSNLTSAKRASPSLRRSLAQRQSMGLSSIMGSPAQNTQFDEYMEIRALEEQADLESGSEEAIVDMNDEDLNDVVSVDEREPEFEEAGDTILEDESDHDSDQDTAQPGELTTDLINFTHASDTAMVDFKKLAEEADELASDAITVDAEDIHAEIHSDSGSGQSFTNRGLETDGKYTAVVVEPQVQLPSNPIEEPTLNVLGESVAAEAESPVLRPVDGQLESPSMLVINQSTSAATSPASSPSAIVYSSTESPIRTSILHTPNRNIKLNDRRIFNTVVSKVPLRPEGSVSPIRVIKKRSRSFGAADTSPAKRISLESLRPLQSTSIDEITESPNRRVRTSVAPSPGGTSTPATSRSTKSRVSLHGFGAVSTPGDLSFSVGDFGESTLDGFDLPEEYEDDSDIVNGQEDFQGTSANSTPRTILMGTPAATRSTHRATTPATITKKTPKTATKTSRRASINTTAERTPLGPVGKGVLYGATVFVDVHTSEGADASGIFIELLTQMGAKCVKEWRWNPRASLALDENNEIAEQRIGITHVVYKDGGKRTLEKVRDAKGEVCCVGVTWVLDCERENKWLDESSYTIDTSIFPRGGSKRRKSMQPRALLVSNDGSVSASRARRSVSAEMNELMKRELIQTPARGSERSDDQDEENGENVDQATPTGYFSYDPRVAMTPGTPYLVSQGKKLTQMSAPPKQQNKSLFEDEDEENDDTFMDGGSKDSGAVKDAKKFRMRNLGDIAKRRRTLGFKPTVGSPLGRH